MAGDFKPAPRKKIPLDNQKFNLRAPNSKGKIASLQWGLVKNNPRITVYTNDPEDTTDYGKITANLDTPTFFAFLLLIEKAIEAPGKYREKIDNMNFTWGGGKRSETPTVVSSLIVGKEESGEVYISITAPRRPNIKFPFRNPEFHSLFKGDGSPFTEGETSVLFAKAYKRMLENVMSHVIVTEYVPPEPKPEGGFGNKGGGGGGNWNRGGGGGGGGAAKSDDEDFGAAW